MRPSLLLLLFLAALSIPATAQNVAITHATLYRSPEAPPETAATVLIHNGKITALGLSVEIPPGTPLLKCNGCAVFAGFWNTHVHFTGPQWDGAAHLPADELSRNMRAMLTHSGFTTVIDLASDPRNTTTLRRRIQSGEVAGPTIFTSGLALYPPHGIPFYLDDLPEAVRAQLPQPGSPAAALQAVRANQAQGADLTKLFTGSYLSPDTITHMPLETAKAAVQAVHDHHQLVFAHPSDMQGVRIAIDSGVDILAHAPDTIEGVTPALANEMVGKHIAMIPTLQLFNASSHIDRIRQFVAQFHRAGGRLLFGTDTGFLTDYDVSEEYHQLQLAGLSFRDVLSMLTTNPAQEFHLTAHAGSLKIGNDGDLTVLSSDPDRNDLATFTRVLYTIRAGKVIFDATSAP